MSAQQWSRLSLNAPPIGHAIARPYAYNTAAITKSAEAYKEGETPYGLFVRNLVFEATERHLSDAFEKFGKVTKAIIARDARGLSRG